MYNDDYEYNNSDYIADKILVQGDGPEKLKAEMRIKFYERGDIENATRFKHGLGYKDPNPEGTARTKSFFAVLLVLSIIAVIFGYNIMSDHDWGVWLALAGLGCGILSLLVLSDF